MYMKHLYVLLILVLLFSCSEKPSSTTEQPAQVSAPAESTNTTPNQEFADLPVGAIKEEYTDTPDIVKVNVGVGASLNAQGTYKNGKRNGTWTEYHPNGLVKSITSYVDGKKEGIFVELNNNGQLVKRVFYHNNLRHGEYKEFNYAAVKEVRTYQFDKLEGVVQIFYDNGKMMEEGNYKNGTRDGISKWYDQNGNMTIQYEYKNGELVSK
jgi:antitoxin component YwqK of YwqJK toxin-antitoxin module